MNNVNAQQGIRIRTHVTYSVFLIYIQIQNMIDGDD